VEGSARFIHRARTTADWSCRTCNNFRGKLRQIQMTEQYHQYRSVAYVRRYIYAPTPDGVLLYGLSTPQPLFLQQHSNSASPNTYQHASINLVQVPPAQQLACSCLDRDASCVAGRNCKAACEPPARNIRRYSVCFS
jgi:hypothetical protein